MQYLKSYLLILLAAVATSGSRINAQAHVVENQTTYVYVDANSGNDSNSGAVSSPYKTIQAAINKSSTLNRASVGSKVIINPGIYRESINLTSYNTTTATLTVQAATTGTAIISASDVLTGWTQESPSIYSTNWATGLGPCAIPAGWPTNFAPIARRAELVFVDGVPLTETVAYSELVPGTFFVDESANKMYVSPSSTTNMATAVVEAAVRRQTMTMSGRTNVVLRGLVFRHAANCMNSSSASVNGSTNVLIDSVQAMSNNWGGIGIFNNTNVTVQNSVASFNGGVGFTSTKDQSTLFSFDESDYNNWRGAQAAYYDWAMGGTKFFQMRTVTVQNHFSFNNQAQGLWFDTDNKNVLVDNATLSGNVQAALQIERNEGPIAVQNSHLCYSGQGINVLTSSALTVKNNSFYSNSGTNKYQADIYLAGQTGGIVIVDWQTGQSYDLFTTGMVLSGNAFQGTTAGQLNFGTYLGGSDWTNFWSTLQAGNNTWYNAATPNAFKIPNGKTVNLAGWQSAISSDYSSSWAPSATSPVAACTAPTPSLSDFNVNVDNRAYTMTSGKATVNLNLNSFGNGPVNLRVAGVPSGVAASFSQQTLVSGSATLTFTSSPAAVSQNVPITMWANSGSTVHSVTFYLQVAPFATAQTTPTVTWSAPAGIVYGTALSATQLSATMSVAGICSYAPAAGTVLTPGTQTLTANCVPTDTVSYKTPAAATVSISLSKAPLTITASSKTVAYGDAIPTITPSYNGFVNGDTSFSITTAPVCTTSYTPTSAVGSSPASSCSSAASSKYSVSYLPGTVSVTKAVQTVTFAQPTTPVSYGGAAIPISATSTSGLPITFSGTPGVCNVSGTTLSFIGVGTCTVSASQPGNTNYSAATTISRTINVNVATLTITASSPTLSYGDALPTITPSYIGFVNGDSGASLTAAPSCTTAYSTTSAVGSSPVTNCSGAVAPNYSISYIPGSVSISKATQTLNFVQPATPVSYGSAPLLLAATSTSGMPISFTSTGGACSFSGGSLNIVGQGNCTITASQTGNNNYSAASTVTRVITVTPAPLTITASSPTVGYGDAVPAITPSYGGFVNGDTFNSLTTAPICSTSYTSSNTVGSSPSTSCSGAVNANYSISYVPGAVTITKAGQTITFAQPATPISYGAAIIPLAATSTSGLPVTFSGTAGVCNVSAATLSVIGAGTCSVSATQTGNANYSAAVTVSRNVTVNPASLTITASSSTATFGSAIPVITPIYSGFVNGDTTASLTTAPTCSTSYTSTSAVGSITPTNCSGAVDVNYSIHYVAGSVTVVQGAQSITPTPVFSLPAGTYTSVQNVSISVATSGATIYYTMDGKTPTTSSTVYTQAIKLDCPMTVKAIAVANGSPVSAVATANFTINLPQINFIDGFASSGSVRLNGKSTVSGTALELTDGKVNEASSAFFATPVNVTKFSTAFTILQTAASGDGMMFVIQNSASGAAAVGPSGSSLGYSYGPTQPGAILNSIGVKFDLYSNVGEGVNSTGLFTNGARPTTPALDMTSSGVDLHSGHPMCVQLNYDGTTLKMTIKDTVTAKSYSASWAINISRTIGSSTAYVGFTASTGGATAVQEVLNWTY